MTMKHSAVPLYVDLDGTLIHSDLLLESALALLKRNPFYLFAFVFWLSRGRASLKREIARRTEMDVSTLPWDTRIVELVHEESKRRRVVLCTAADEELAQAVAAYVGGFHAVMASDGARNLSGNAKARALFELHGERGFDYAGNEARDLAVWRHARAAYVANGSASLTSRVRNICEVVMIIPRQRTNLRTWLKALRLHQWLKNVLVFVPLLAGHMVLQAIPLARAMAAFVIFGMCASGVYVLNDLLDLRADRKHPRKKMRPFATGALPLSAGLIVAPLLTAMSFVASVMLSGKFTLVLLGYYVLTLAYSLRLKQIAMLDVVVLAGLYTVRIVAGAAAISSGLSFWLLAFSMFLFLSLAILKRYTELGMQRDAGSNHAPGRSYQTSDYELLASLGGASGYLSVLVLALYINSTASAMLYRHPQWLWLLCPLLLYWISRAWIIAHRGIMRDDPVVFALTDRVSRFVLVLGTLVAVLAIR